MSSDSPAPHTRFMNEMTNAEAMQFLSDQKVGHLAVIDDSEPYVSPISYVVDGDKLYFRSRPGRRLSALATNPRLCVEASEVDEVANTWTSVCAWGSAEIVTSAETDVAVIAMLLAKYADASESVLSFASGPSFGEEPIVVAVPIDNVTGRRSGPHLGAHIRPGRL